MSLLVAYQILGLFLNTLTADEKHFFCNSNSESLQQPIQIHLPKKLKLFSLNLLLHF